jgi:hypothetical protein
MVFLVSSSVVRSDNTCNCQNPPGGSVRCEQGQVPMCNVNNGRVFAECKSPPKNAQSGVALELWYASELLKRKVTLEDLGRPEVQQALRTGTVRTSSGVTTSLPFDSRMAINPRREP